MEKENKYLKDRIKFLEALLDINAETLDKTLETNRILIEELKKESLDRPSTG